MCSTAERNSPLSSCLRKCIDERETVFYCASAYIIVRRYSYGRWPDLFANSLSTAVQSLA
jgi:hypothetical protein